MSDALKVLKRIVREEYKNITDGINNSSVANVHIRIMVTVCNNVSEFSLAVRL